MKKIFQGKCILWDGWKYLEMDGNKSTTYQNLWDTGDTKVQRKFRAENAYIKKEEISIDNFTP